MRDLKMSADGDLVLGPDGDFQSVDGDEWLSQEILFRLKTTKGDWLLDPDVGADLEQFIGQPNTDETHRAIEAAVFSALIIPGFLTTPTVEAVPLDETTVFILVEYPSIETEERVIQIQSELDLKKGLVASRITFASA